MTNEPASLASSHAFTSTANPEEVVVTADRQHLRLGWHGGESLTLTAEDMRFNCRCAWCTLERRNGTFPEEFKGASISGVELVGDYAVNIAFADGHARGVYPWPYLRAIGSQNNEQSDELSA